MALSRSVAVVALLLSLAKDVHLSGSRNFSSLIRTAESQIIFVSKRNFLFFILISSLLHIVKVNGGAVKLHIEKNEHR